MKNHSIIAVENCSGSMQEPPANQKTDDVIRTTIETNDWESLIDRKTSTNGKRPITTVVLMPNQMCELEDEDSLPHEGRCGPFVSCSVFIQKIFVNPVLFPASPQPPLGRRFVHCLWSFVATLIGLGPLCLIQWLVLSTDNKPANESGSISLVAFSFGAAAVLFFDACDAPLIQPRNSFLGQLISAAVGISTRICLGGRPYLAGPFAVALAIIAMRMFNATHPPGGATAFITASTTTGAASNGPIAYVFLLCPILVGTLWLTIVALVFNNLNPKRQYPKHWL